MQYTSRKGFTLIELLVVIAIIAILGGLLLPAINGVKKKGYEARARTEVKSLETALKAYLNEYNKYPEKTGATDENQTRYGDNVDNNVLISALSGTNSTVNPRKIVFLEIPDKSIDNNGNMIDPWKNQYRVAIDFNFNNIVTSGDSKVGNISGRNIIVWSIGIDGDTNSYIRSWE